MEENKSFFRDKKNIVIIILSIILLINISVYASLDSSKNDTLNEDLIKQEETIKQLENQVTTLQNKNQSLNEENQNLKSEKGKLEEEKQSLSTQIEEIKKTSSTVSQDNKSTQNSNTTSKQTTSKSTTNKSTSNTNKKTNSATVYVTRTGKKYHKDGCSYLKDSKIAKQLSEATSQGYTPCSRCY